MWIRGGGGVVGCFKATFSHCRGRPFIGTEDSPLVRSPSLQQRHLFGTQEGYTLPPKSSHTHRTYQLTCPIPSFQLVELVVGFASGSCNKSDKSNLKSGICTSGLICDERHTPSEDHLSCLMAFPRCHQWACTPTCRREASRSRDCPPLPSGSSVGSQTC